MKPIRFVDRQDAGQRLTTALRPGMTSPTILLALPRGGVEVGAVVARVLNLHLSIVVARKIGHPGNPEYAIGAVTATGQPVFNRAETDRLDPRWLEAAVERERREAGRRQRVYLGNRPTPNFSGQHVILIDDGLATGLTAETALQEIRSSRPASITLAVPVAPADSLARLQPLVDNIVTLNTGGEFDGAVAAHYRHFPQLTDADVRHWLDALY